MEILSLLASTIVFRYYVFLFLIFFLISSALTFGIRKTLVLFFITWFIAFVAEFSSTRIGIPFGDYYYIPSTQNQELWISNIPFMDSLSFTFLAYASYTLSLFFFLRPSTDRKGFLQDNESIRHSFRVLGLSVVFFVLLDVVIDPLALRGDRWFLGKIYGYPSEGVYFGVPVSNFIGWAVVGGTSLFLYQRVEQWEGKSVLWEVSLNRLLLGPLLYLIVLVFNITMTFYIEERLLGMVGILIYFPIIVFFLIRFFDVRRVYEQGFHEAYFKEGIEIKRVFQNGLYTGEKPFPGQTQGHLSGGQEPEMHQKV